MQRSLRHRLWWSRNSSSTTTSSRRRGGGKLACHHHHHHHVVVPLYRPRGCAAAVVVVSTPLFLRRSFSSYFYKAATSVFGGGGGVPAASSSVDPDLERPVAASDQFRPQRGQRPPPPPNHPWTERLAYESILQRGYDLLERAKTELVEPPQEVDDDDYGKWDEWRVEAEQCLADLFGRGGGRGDPTAADYSDNDEYHLQDEPPPPTPTIMTTATLEGIDLGFLLMDHLVTFFSFHNASLMNTMLFSWHSVTKTALSSTSTNNNNKSNYIDNLILPEKLLSLLDGWTSQLRHHHHRDDNDGVHNNNDRRYQQPSPSYHHHLRSLVTWKALSLMIYICNLQSKQTADLTQRRKLAEFTEGLLRRLAQKKSSRHHHHHHDHPFDNNNDDRYDYYYQSSWSESTTTTPPPSASNLNATLAIWASLPDPVRAKQLFDAAVNTWGVIPDTRTYNAVLLSHADEPETAESLLYEWQDKIDILSWNIVLNAWAKRSDFKRVEQLLYSMTVRPNLYTYNTALKVWAKAGKVELCQQVIAEMHKAYHQSTAPGGKKTLDAPPDLVTYGILMHAFAKAGMSDEAEELANELYTQYLQYGRDELKPTLKIYTPILQAYSQRIRNLMMNNNNDDNDSSYSISHPRSNNDGTASSKNNYNNPPHPDDRPPPDLGAALAAIARAHMVLERMHGLYAVGALDERPDAPAFLALLQCYKHVHLAKRSIAERSEDILYEMLERFPHDPHLFAAYSIVIQIWLKLGKDGVTRAKELLDEAWKEDGIRSNMDAHSLHSIVCGFTRADFPEVAQLILLRWCEAVLSQHMTVCPKVSTFGSLIGAWKRSSLKTAPKQADIIFNELEKLRRQVLTEVGQLDRMVYEGMVKCWAFANVDGNERRAHTYLTMMRNHAKLGHAELVPPKELYHLVLFACGRGLANPLLAEQILVEMTVDCKLGARYPAPCARAFNSALTAWRKSGRPDLSRRAYLLFEEMEKRRVPPDVITYKLVLSCLALGRQPDDVERAGVIFRKIQAQPGMIHSDRDMVDIYCNVITVLCRARDPNRAHALLMEMCNGIIDGKVQAKPPPWVFDIVIKCMQSRASSGQIETIKKLKGRILRTPFTRSPT